MSSHDKQPEVSRFCELVSLINDLNAKLQREYAAFYDGGHSFEECYATDIAERDAAQTELSEIIREINTKMIHEKKGDLFEEIRDYDVLIHGCNCFCSMGKGFATEVKRRYPSAYAADMATTKGDKAKLGRYTSALVVTAGRELTVVNAYTQYRYGQGGPHFDMAAWRSFLRLMKSDFPGKRFVMPKVGAGLAGGRWSEIRAVLEEVLGGEDVWVVNIE